MAVENVLTGLINDLHANVDKISREGQRFIMASTKNQELSRVAKDDPVTVPIVPAAVIEDIVPTMNQTDGTGQTIGNVQMSITKSRRAKYPWTGEQQRSLNVSGPGHPSIMTNQIIQAMRAITNEMESDLGTEISATASRAIGIAGTTPFASTKAETALARQVLFDNGSPLIDMEMVINSTAGVNLRNLGILTKANEAGTDQPLRTGVLHDIDGFAIGESAGVQSPTKGTGTSYTTDTAGYSVGDTDITLITGSGTVVAGDIVTFAGDTTKYVVASGITAPGVLSIAAPGLLLAITTSATDMTIGTAGVHNAFYSRSALYLLNRLPALPVINGVVRDAAIDRTVFVDPFSGIPFDIAVYAGDNMMQVTVGTAWGQRNIKPEHSGLLLG